MAKKLLGLLALALLSLVGLYLYQAKELPLPLHTPEPPAAARVAARTVRVGYLSPDPYVSNGIETRHFYGQYMKELAKYLSWTYELVEVSPEESFYKLASGEIDLLLPMEINSSREARLRYTKHHFYLDALGLYTRQTEKHFSSRDLSTLDGATVGLYANRPANEVFLEFCRENNVQPQTRTYPDQKAILVALRKGDIDLVVDSATNITSEEKLLVAFDMVETFVAALPEKQELLDDLDQADARLMEENPDYVSQLELSLQESLRPHITNYTPAESTFIRQSRPLRVAFFHEAAPYVEYNLALDNVHGIYPDIFRLLANHSGFSFDFLHFASYEDARRALREGKADLMIDTYSAHMQDYDQFYYSSPLFQQECTFIGPTTASEGPGIKAEPHTLALEVANSPTGLVYLQYEFPRWNIRQYGSIIDCLEAVKRKEADYALIDTMNLQAERALLMYPTLAPLSATGTSLPVCLTISKEHPPLLKAVLNKTLLRISPDEIKQIIGKHRLAEKPRFSLSYAISHYPLQTGLSLGLFLLTIAVIIFSVHHISQEKKQRQILTRKNEELEKTLSELREAQKSRDAYKEKAETDALTGVLNKAAIESFAKKALSRLAYGQESTDAFIIVDLDHFKEANDTRGHQYGDDILRDFAHALIRLTRHRDGVGRFGGDEFIIYLKNIPSQTLHTFAQRLMKAAHDLDPVQRPPLSASIGIAIIDRPGLEYEAIFHQADQALYQVKEGGRDGYRIYGS